MSGSIYDHLMALVLVSGLFAATVAVLPNIGYLGLLGVDQQQLRNIAVSSLNTILLDAGYPLTWGSTIPFDSAQLVRFGLASPTSSELYTLDSDKVQKLVTANPSQVGSLTYAQVRSLLGLQNYGFKLKILAPFDVAVRDMAPPQNPENPTQAEMKTIDYEVTVKLNDGKPVPNAQVNALIFVCIVGSNEIYSVQNLKQTSSTNELGVSRVQRSLEGQVSDVVLIFDITVGDIHTISAMYRKGSAPQDVATINMVGDRLILTIPPVDVKDNRWIRTVQVFTGDGSIISLYNGTHDDVVNWGSTDEWFKDFPGLQEMDPVLMIVGFWAVEKNNGRKGIFVMGPFPRDLGNRVGSFGFEGEVPGGLPGAKIIRAVTISGMTYIVDFTLWKER